MNEPHPRTAWVEIGKQVLSFIVGVIVAAFILGRNSQRINDVVQWKTQIAPVIERMDSRGSLSFEHWQRGYDKQELRTEEHFKKLDAEIDELQKKIDP